MLNEIDVRDTFRYQMSQVEEFDSIDLTIDAEAPTVELISYNPAFPYLSGNDTLLQVDASDPTSGIGMVEMQVLYHGALAPGLPGGARLPGLDPGHFILPHLRSQTPVTEPTN